jgi:hypothetical protein
MALARIWQLSILVILAAALVACGESRDASAPAGQAPAESAPAQPAPSEAAPGQPAPPAPEVEPVPQPASILIEIFSEGMPEAAAGGRGTLAFQGRTLPLVISGVTLPASSNVPKAEMVGDVQQLFRAEDIAGTYTAKGAGAKLSGGPKPGGGPKLAQLENPQGVTLRLLGKKLGPDVSLDLNGMQIQLAQ